MPEPDNSFDSKTRRTSLRTLQVFLGIAVLLLLAVIVPPLTNIKRFRSSIVHSIGEGLGRPVRADAVELTLLPRPAFVLHRFTVEEDPIYGAEPVLMADTVTASLRASTLWHRRVEIATLHFDAPSLNLTRNSAGHWNFETLLHGSSRPASTLSAQSTASTRLPFPYVEATEARINFKLGAEKLPFSLEGADLAVWKEAGSEWHLRLRARPVRTDLTVADAGQIRGNAVLQAAGPLENAPVHANLEWRRVELGEIGRLLHGEDNNWRGIVDWTASAQGTLAEAQLSTDVQVSEFRRAEFVPAAEMGLLTHCSGKYSRALNALDAFQCSVPLGTGMLRLRGRGFLPLTGAGSAVSPLQETRPAIVAGFQHVPARYFLALLRQIHPGVSGAASVRGELTGSANCRWAGLHPPNLCTGQLQSTALALSLPQLEHPLRFSPLTLSASSAEPADSKKNRVLPERTAFHSALANISSGRWQLEPSRIFLGAGAPATLSGALDSNGLTLKIMGPAALRDVVRLSQALRIPALSGDVRIAQGTAQLGLTLQTAWLPQPASAGPALAQAVQFAPSRWTGNLQIRNATVSFSALPGTLQLASAQVNLTRDAMEWTRLNGTYGRIPFEGSLRWQTPCAGPQTACSRKLVLHIASLNPANFLAALHPGTTSRLFDIVNPWSAASPTLPLLHGAIDVDLLTVGRLSIQNAAFGLELAGHTAKLLSISGNVFGGTISAGDPASNDAAEQKLKTGPVALSLPGSPAKTEVPSGVGSVQWGEGAPVYSLRASLIRIQPGRVAALWREHWGAGVADAAFSLTTQGWSASDLTQHARGKFSIHWANGTLASSETSPTIAFQSWRAAGRIADQALVLRSGQIAGWEMAQSSDPAGSPSPAAFPVDNGRDVPAQAVTGSVSFGRKLDLQLQPAGILLSGTLASPTVTEKKTKGTPTEAQP